MANFLHLDSVIEGGRYKDFVVSSLVHNKRAMFNLIKAGYQFDDDVLRTAHIKKITHGPKFSYDVAEHKMDSSRKYSKDRESLDNVLKKLMNNDDNTIDYGEYS